MYNSLATFKAYLGIDVADVTRDALLTLALNTAMGQINELAGRTFEAATASATARVYHTTRASFIADPDIYSPGATLLVDPIGDLTGLAVATGNTSTGTFTTLPATTYDPGPDNAIVKGQPVTFIRNLSYGWKLYPYVQVTARYGWPVATPPAILTAELLQGGRLFKRKDSLEGVVGSADWGAITVRKVDPDVMALISPYCMPGFA